MKKIFRLIGAVAAVALPQFALANSSVSPQALGTVQAVVDYCLRVDPADASRIRAQQTALLKGLSSQTITGLRGSSDYQQSYELISGLLGKISSHEGAQSCKGSRSGKEVEKRPNAKVRS